MSTSNFTLGHFFGLDGNGAHEPRQSGFASSQPVEGLRRALIAKARGLSWPAVASELEQKLAGLLDVEIARLLLLAWQKSATIHAQLSKSAASPGETFLVHLAEHTLSSSHRPHLEIYFQGALIHRFKIEVMLELAIEGAILKLEAGRIREVKPGTVKGQGTIALDGVAIARQETRPIELPGTIRLAAREPAERPAKPAAGEPRATGAQPAPAIPVAESEASTLSRISLR